MKSKSINVKEASFPDFSAGDNDRLEPSEDYSSLLMDVPLDVKVEIGKTKLRMKEVLSLVQGSIIKLEKQAGAPVEVVANKQVVARGDVIVIDENFGVRITEIIANRKFIRDAEKAEEQKAEFRDITASENIPATLTENTETADEEPETDSDQREENEE